MTDKRAFEDKSETAPLPRSLTNLLTATEELRVAVARGRTSDLEGLLEGMEKSWRSAQSDNINIFSRQGDALNCERYATALNDANGLVFSARALLMR